MKKIFPLILSLIFVFGNAVFAQETATDVANNNQQAQSTENKQTVKRCPCKKIFEKTLALTPEQIKLADKNRAEERKELEAINQKIKKLRTKTSIEGNFKSIEDLKAQKLEIKAKHNEIFESYLTDEQKNKLAQMREDKKKGISCCHCRKNPYY